MLEARLMAKVRDDQNEIREIKYKMAEGSKREQDTKREARNLKYQLIIAIISALAIAVAPSIIAAITASHGNTVTGR